MQALVWTGPRQMELQDVPPPHAPAGEIVLRVAAVGLCGSDLSGYLGHNSLRVPPLIMGHEFAGTIVEVAGTATLASGEAAAAGQRVVVNPLISCGECDLCRLGRQNLCRYRQIIGIHRPGALADLVAAPAAQCYAVPDGVTDDLAAMAEPLACGIRAFAQTRLGGSGTLLILGAGSIGLMCLVAARHAGLDTLIVTDTSAQRLAVARELGASAIIQVDQADVLEEVARLSNGLGVDAVIDAVGLTSTREQAVRAVRPGGQVVFIGLHHETSEVAANYLVRQEIEIAGAFAYLPQEFQRAVAMLGQNALGAARWVTEQTFAQGADVFADLAAGRGDYVKVALRPA